MDYFELPKPIIDTTTDYLDYRRKFYDEHKILLLPLDYANNGVSLELDEPDDADDE